jgi:uncharacterized protein YndB with AHSA1/START domain
MTRDVDTLEHRGPALRIERFFDAPRYVVYQAWIDHDCMAQWPAPNGFLITHSEGDVRRGGVWRTAMRSPGGEELWLGGRYEEVIENELLSFTHAWDDRHGTPGHETFATLRLDEMDGGTRMVFEQVGFASEADRDGHRAGWSQAFDRLSDLLSRTLHHDTWEGRSPVPRI